MTENSGALKTLHRFADKELQKRACTHASAGAAHNERLEWLGDALCDFLVGDLLFAQYPALPEGKLTLARSFLVGDNHLATIARRTELPHLLILSPAEERDGGRNRDSILAGAVEAYLAAIYLDGGINAARNAVKVLFADSLNDVRRRIRQKNALQDSKTRLQEYLQKRAAPPPQYRILQRGQISRRTFCIAECRTEKNVTLAIGSNRRESEQIAAAAILAFLEK